MSLLTTLAPAIQLVYIALWVVLVGVLLRFGRPALAAAIELTQAITRASDALRSIAADAGASREAVMRVEAATVRMETKLDLLLQQGARAPDSKPRR